MPLLVVQILQLQMQPIDFLPRLRRRLLRASHLQDGIPIQAAQLRQVRIQQLLPSGQFQLYVRGGGVRGGDGVCFGKINQLRALLSRPSRCFEHIL